MALRSFIDSEDPLCSEALCLLLDHQEEDSLVDYKESFSPANEKEWLGLTADALAFANTRGGYIVFGVKDGVFLPVGIDQGAIKALTDTALVLQKLNRHVGPPFINIRTKKFQNSGLHFAVWFIPESQGRTHIVVKEGKVRYPGGRSDTILRPGVIYTRRSGTNQIMEPEDLEFLLSRRIDHFKSSILDKIAKVVHSPADHEVIVFDPKSHPEDAGKFAISDSPDAIPLKGLSFTIAPSTDMEELAGWIAFLGCDPQFQPRPERLWKLYVNRLTLKVSGSQIEGLVRFSLLGEIPVFYWLRKMDSEGIFQVLSKALSSASSIGIKAYILHVGAFLGKGLYNKLLTKLDATKLNWRSRKFPHDPRIFFYPSLIPAPPKRKKKDDNIMRPEELEGELNEAAKKLAQLDRDPYERNKALAIDCFLYARNDLYKNKEVESVRLPLESSG